MLTLNKDAQPVKVLHDKRLAYLVGLEDFYKSLGYVTKVNGRDNLLEVYPAGTELPKTQEEIILEKWID